MTFLRNKKGQNTAEYAILIALIIGAAVAMQTYVKRSLQGGIKYAVDKVKKNDTATGQYEPYYSESSYTGTTSEFKDKEEVRAGGEVVRTYGADGLNKTTTRSGSQAVRNVTGAD